ncbi:hypothetical protein [Streptomyces sp. HJ7]
MARYNCAVDLRNPAHDTWDNLEEFTHDAVNDWTAGVQVLECWVEEHQDDPLLLRVRVWEVNVEALRDPHATVPAGDPTVIVTYDDLEDAKSEQAADNATVD